MSEGRVLAAWKTILARHVLLSSSVELSGFYDARFVYVSLTEGSKMLLPCGFSSADWTVSTDIRFHVTRANFTSALDLGYEPRQVHRLKVRSFISGTPCHVDSIFRDAKTVVSSATELSPPQFLLEWRTTPWGRSTGVSRAVNPGTEVFERERRDPRLRFLPLQVCRNPHPHPCFLSLRSRKSQFRQHTLYR